MSLVRVSEIHRLVLFLYSFSLLVPLCEVLECVCFITVFTVRVIVIKVIFEAEVNIFVLLGANILELVIQVFILNLVVHAERFGSSRDLLFLLSFFGDGFLLNLNLLFLLFGLFFLFGEDLLLASTDVEDGAGLLNVSQLGSFVHVRVCVMEHKLGHGGKIGWPRAKHSLLTRLRGIDGHGNTVILCLLVHELIHGFCERAHCLSAVLREGQEQLGHVMNVLGCT